MELDLLQPLNAPWLKPCFLPWWNTVLFSCSSVGLFLTCKFSFWFPVAFFSQLLPRERPKFQGQFSFYHAEFKKTLSSFILVRASHANLWQRSLWCNKYHSVVNTVTKVRFLCPVWCDLYWWCFTLKIGNYKSKCTNKTNQISLPTNHSLWIVVNCSEVNKNLQREVK